MRRSCRPYHVPGLQDYKVNDLCYQPCGQLMSGQSLAAARLILDGILLLQPQAAVLAGS